MSLSPGNASSGTVEVTPADSRAGRIAVATILASAFYDDPLFCYWFPDPRSRGRRARTHVLAAQHAFPGYLGGEAGAAMWLPPGKPTRPTRVMLRLVVQALRAHGRWLGRLWKTARAVEAHKPAEPHWYLYLLGTVPERQGQGVGSALLRSMLASCDEQGVMAYLENTNEKNLSFYRRHGFEVVTELKLPKGGPTLWPMLRRPRAA